MNTNLTDIENRLWSAADELRANSRLKASEYSTPVLGLIFLRYADHKFTQAQKEISSRSRSKQPQASRPENGMSSPRCPLSARAFTFSIPTEFARK